MKRDTLARWLILLALGAAAAAISIYLPVVHWLQTIITWVRGLGAPGGLIYGLIYAAGTVLMVPGTLLTAVAGLLYGVLIGVLIVSPASVLGATLAFLLGRYVARDWVARKLQRYPKFMAIDRAIERNGFWVVLLMRLEPVFLPFALLNYALGMTRVRVRDYVLASWIGMLPATILYVYLGSVGGDLARLLQGDFRHSLLTQWLFWLGLAATALLVLVLVRIGRRALREQIADAESAENQRSIGIPPERHAV
jgi:uncharacterized membrane protein YdjX (TVP38/TMEM64 family)